MTSTGSSTTAQPIHLNDSMDLMAEAALAIHKDASTSREMARDLRRHARQDSMERHQQVAEKLREMAQSSLGSSILQGAVTIGSAACNLAAGLKEIKAKGLSCEVMKQSEKTKTSWLKAGGKGLEALSKVDPFGIHRQYQAVEKKEIENLAMQAEDRVKEQSDQEAEARRLESSSLNLMQKLLDGRHQAIMASTRG